ncbi:hypothetical protein N7532_002218 [Penicillium argentinense]|uniref:Uncharacterized protein n=1 Tax=Penicillium argentinense TaxID=1131581 RepID=A0A9W9KLA0_9EURO|nr:uncharacterized protein N7532_002218 [Penicillium argentinense]KAJ5109573.1 hypothetical protein N7532_002218 [Penicillium argentinense]
MGGARRGKLNVRHFGHPSAHNAAPGDTEWRRGEATTRCDGSATSAGCLASRDSLLRPPNARWATKKAEADSHGPETHRLSAGSQPEGVPVDDRKWFASETVSREPRPVALARGRIGMKAWRNSASARWRHGISGDRMAWLGSRPERRPIEMHHSCDNPIISAADQQKHRSHALRRTVYYVVVQGYTRVSSGPCDRGIPIPPGPPDVRPQLIPDESLGVSHRPRLAMHHHEIEGKCGVWRTSLGSQGLASCKISCPSCLTEQCPS